MEGDTFCTDTDIKPDIVNLFRDEKPIVNHSLFSEEKPDIKNLFLDVKPDVKPDFTASVAVGEDQFVGLSNSGSNHVPVATIKQETDLHLFSPSNEENPKLYGESEPRASGVASIAWPGPTCESQEDNISTRHYLESFSSGDWLFPREQNMATIDDGLLVNNEPARESQHRPEDDTSGLLLECTNIEEEELENTFSGKERLLPPTRSGIENKPHSESTHFIYTHRLCRTCGLRIHTSPQWNAKMKPYECMRYAQTILKLFHIDVTKDTAMHSSKLCHSCYFRLRDFKTKPLTDYSLQIAQKLADTHRHIWCDYDEKLSSQQCSLCSHFYRLSKSAKMHKRRNFFQMIWRGQSHVSAAPVQNSDCSSLFSTENSNSSTLTLDECPTWTPEDSACHNYSYHDEKALVTPTPPMKNRCRRHLLLETNPGPLTVMAADAAKSLMPVPYRYSLSTVPSDWRAPQVFY